ncbi:MAG: hypothetical protein VW886_07190, partial [Candidatus Heimdallarchaeota archaeon]
MSDTKNKSPDNDNIKLNQVSDNADIFDFADGITPNALELSSTTNAKVLLLYTTNRAGNSGGLASIPGIFDNIDIPLDTINYNASNSNYDTYINYDVIILQTSGTEYNNESKGNDLADYVDQGGKIIMHSPVFGSYPLTGRISDYFPFRVSSAAGDNMKSATYNVNTNHSLFEGVTSIVSCTYCVYRITSVSAGTTILATWNSGQFSGMHFVGIKGNVIGVNLFPGYSYTDDFLRFYSNLLEYAGVSLIDGLNSYEYKFNSQDAVLSLNVSIQNGTTYDSYLNDELVETQNYQNGTIAVNISSIFTDFSYSNFSISNYTKYEFTNVTLAFHTLQNKTFTHFVNVTVYDYIPQIFHNIFDIDHEVATSQILHFNVSDDDLDSLKVYQNNTQLYSTDWNSSNPSMDLNEFLDETFNLTQYNFTLSFIDSNSN